MHTWWDRDVIGAGKLPLMICFLSFVVTFASTRTITRMIRAGRGPFRDRFTGTGLHVHHAVPGLGLLITGAFVAVAAHQRSGWTLFAAVCVGVGTSLVLDEFALILHLTDVYWSNEGRLSVDLVSLTAASLALALVGLSPVGVDDVGGTELAVRLGATALLVVHGALVLISVLKGKYALALLGLFAPPVVIVAAVRLARPGSVWFRHRYGPERERRATHRTAEFDARWDPLLHRWTDLIGGSPTRAGHQPVTASEASDRPGLTPCSTASARRSPSPSCRCSRS